MFARFDEGLPVDSRAFALDALVDAVGEIAVIVDGRQPAQLFAKIPARRGGGPVPGRQARFEAP